MNGISKLFERLSKLRNKQFRHAYTKEHIYVGIASQIRLIRKKLNISQTQLADIIGTKQSMVSRIEDPDSGSVNLKTLIKIAEALDVSLIVKFASFGKFLDEYQNISPKDLTVASYDEELEYSSVLLESMQDIERYSTKTRVAELITDLFWTKFSISEDNLSRVTPTIFEGNERSGMINKLSGEDTFDNLFKNQSEYDSQLTSVLTY